MNIGTIRFVLLFTFVLLLSILVSSGVGIANADEPTPFRVPSRSSDDQGFVDLEVAEHRISLTQQDDLNTISVQDEFWIRNSGNEPYYGLIYNWLPDDINTGEGMTCKVSETGGHRCFGWNRENNNYYWDTSNVILPENYAKRFDLEITTYSVDDPTIKTTHTREIDSSSPDSEIMIETDEWGWARDGFNRGWKSILNFTIGNNIGENPTIEINNSRVPRGLTLELYVDNNDDGWLNENDSLVAYDNDHDGYWESVADFDSDNNGIPDISIENENKTFFVYMKANYMLHFFTLYEKYFEPSDNGTITISKQTNYGTSLMRVFVIPKSGTPLGNDDISFQRKSSGSSEYYYGEWNGDEGKEISFELKGALLTPGNENDKQIVTGKNNNQVAITLILGIITVVLVVFIILRKRLARKIENVGNVSENSFKGDKHRPSDENGINIQSSGHHESGEIPETRSTGVKIETSYDQLKEKHDRLKWLTNRIRDKTFHDEIERELEMELCREFEKKLAGIEKKLAEFELRRKKREKEADGRKYLKAIMLLEDDYESGVLDEEVYLELRGRYIEIYEKQAFREWMIAFPR